MDASWIQEVRDLRVGKKLTETEVETLSSLFLRSHTNKVSDEGMRGGGRREQLSKKEKN